MTPNFPPSIAHYISAANQNVTQSVKDCFTEDAAVKDESRTFHGVEEIQQWMKNTKAKYRHTIEPLAVRQEGPSTIVTCRLTGAFPGSPIEVPFRFTQRDTRIVRLEIG